MTPHKIIGVVLRQPLTQFFSQCTAIDRAHHVHSAINRIPNLVLDRWHQPRGIAALRMHSDRDAKTKACTVQPRNVHWGQAISRCVVQTVTLRMI